MKDRLSRIMITRDATIKEALKKLNDSGLGILLIQTQEGSFDRTVTDGDIRRLLLKGLSIDSNLHELPVIQSQVLEGDYTRRDALNLMNRHGISYLPVLDREGHVIDLICRQEIGEQILLSTPHIGDAEREFVDEAFRTNWIAPLGPNVDAFETELSALVGTKYAAALSSGTAAIHLGLRLLNVGPGDRVFCSTLTFAASANPIVYQGAEPVFIDSDLNSWNMCPVALEVAFATAKKEGWMPKAVVVVNLYGQSADMDPISELCNHYGVPILEDAAESLGAKYKGRYSGTFGKLGTYSFNGNKIITTSGGGMLISEDEALIQKARFLATQARDPAPHYQHSEIGFNYRMSNILAGVGRGQLKVLNDRVESRRAVFETYCTQLSGISSIDWMHEPEWSHSTRWLTAAIIRPSQQMNCATLIKKLFDEMIEARPVWKPMHLQPVYANCRYFTAAGEYAEGKKSISDYLFLNGLCLPSGSNMTEEQLDRITNVLRSILK